MSEATPPVDEFTEALPFTAYTAGLAPSASGVHVVRDSDGAPVYVGATGDLRGRLWQHLSGDRQASVLHEQVGAELDGPGHVATAQEIADWLGQCTVAWRLSDDPQELKAQLVADWQPRFNRVTEQPVTGIWWVNQGKAFEQEFAAGMVFAGSGGRQVMHHRNVARMRPGDVVLHYYRGAVVAIGEAAADPVQATRPWGPPAERDTGWLTRVDYFRLTVPVPLAELPKRDGSEGPFTRTGVVRQGYLFALNAEFAAAVRDRFADRWPPGSPWAPGERRFWLFQANPNQWDLLQHLPEMPPGHVDDWTVTRHRNDMQPGDGVVLWQAGPAAGVYALGRLVDRPQLKSNARIPD